MISTIAARSETHCASWAIASHATAMNASSSNFFIIAQVPARPRLVMGLTGSLHAQRVRSSFRCGCNPHEAALTANAPDPGRALHSWLPDGVEHLTADAD